MNRKVSKVIFIVPLFLLASSCSFSTQWTAFYYKNGNTMADPIMQSGFTDSASCLSWARNQKQALNDLEGSYECGSNCEIKDSSLGLYICDETID